MEENTLAFYILFRVDEIIDLPSFTHRLTKMFNLKNRMQDKLFAL